MGRVGQILVIQGAGAGVHDEWDNRLVDSLRRELGDGCEVRYPRMPDEDDPSYVTWSAAIRREIAALADGAVVVSHSRDHQLNDDLREVAAVIRRDPATAADRVPPRSPPV